MSSKISKQGVDSTFGKTIQSLSHTILILSHEGLLPVSAICEHLASEKGFCYSKMLCYLRLSNNPLGHFAPKVEISQVKNSHLLFDAERCSKMLLEINVSSNITYQMFTSNFVVNTINNVKKIFGRLPPVIVFTRKQDEKTVADRCLVDYFDTILDLTSSEDNSIYPLEIMKHESTKDDYFDKMFGKGLLYFTLEENVAAFFKPKK